MSRSFSGIDSSAVENLLSQAKDQYVLEQVAKINCSGFTDDDDSAALTSSIESRFRRLKSLPVTRTNPAWLSSKNLPSQSKIMASYPEKKMKSHGNVSSASASSSFSRNLAEKSCPLDSSVDNEIQFFPGTKLYPSVNSGFEKNSRSGFRGFSDSVRTGSSSSRKTMKLVPRENSRISSTSFVTIDLASPGLEESSRGRRLEADFGRIGSSSSISSSQQGKSLTLRTQTLELIDKEESTIRSCSPNSIDSVASPSSDQDQEDVMKPESKSKSKSKFLISWFDKLPLAQAMSCLRGKSSSKSKKTKELEKLKQQIKKRRDSTKRQGG